MQSLAVFRDLNGLKALHHAKTIHWFPLGLFSQHGCVHAIGDLAEQASMCLTFASETYLDFC